MSGDSKIFIGIGVVTVIIVIIGALTIGNRPGKNQDQKTLDKAKVEMLVRGDTHAVRAAKAKVTVVEFGDFQCPACGVAHTVAKQIKNDYKGRINFAFREFPLIQVHKNAYVAALAAEAAGGQGKFWEMHDLLFENQEKWSEKKDPVDVFAVYAKKIGIDVDKFKKDVKDKKYDKNIQSDMDDGTQLGISSTPTFFINDKVYPGVLKYDEFKSNIEGELKK